MRVINTEINEVLVIESDFFSDRRGWFTELYSKESLSKAGIDNEFVQDNLSFTKKKNTIRGLHLQNDPYSQSKLVTCLNGKVRDIVVDLRQGSPNYLKWISIELSSDNRLQLFVPKGFAHGFLTLTDNVLFHYKVDAHYNKNSEITVRYDDPLLSINWGTIDPILSEKDLTAPTLEQSKCNYIFNF